MKVQISIRPRLATAGSAASEIAAWFIPGKDPSAWLAEIMTWTVPHHDLRLLVVPQSKSDLTPVGVFAIGPVPAREDVGSCCVPYALYSDTLKHVLIPIGSELYPAIGPAMLKRLTVEANTYVWHPTIGLIVASPEECIRVSDLVASPKQSAAQWDDSEQGVFFSSRLTSIKAIVMPSAEDVLSDGRDDIGENAPEIKNIPKPTDSSDNIVGQAGIAAANGVLRPLAHLAKFVSGMVPAGGTQRTMFNSMDDWANRVLNSVSENLLWKRNKELSRLMKMLEDDPDKGLKYALPMTGAGSRGVARPGSSLMSNLLDFNMRNVFGGSGPTDVWDIPGEIRIKMNQRYRELAQREMNLGRYRRAAYIYAHLLSDFPAAAQALEQGGHFREAAVLYREKLRNTEKAIVCLQSGGLWTEAIEICVETNRWEKAGDLYTEIEREDMAVACYENAASGAREKNKLIEAARIEETKLKDLDAALITLAAGWPGNEQVVPCVRETFRILRESGRHEETQVWLGWICDEAKRIDVHPGVVELVADTAINHPDRITQTIATDSTRRIVSLAIKRGVFNGMPRMLSAVSRLAPQDRVLRRDCSRFGVDVVGKQRNLVLQSDSNKLKVNSDRSEKEIGLVSSFWLSGKTLCQSAVGFRDCLFVVGVLDSRRLEVIRSDWNGTTHSEFMKYDGGQASLEINIIGKACSLFVGVHLVGAMLKGTTTFCETSDLRAMTVGSPPCDERSKLGVEMMQLNQWCCVRWVSGTLVVDMVDEQGGLITSRFLRDFDDESSLTMDAKVFSNGRTIYAYVSGFDGERNEEFSELIILGHGNEDQQRTVELDHPVRELTGSARGTRPRIAVAFDYGVQVIWDELNSIKSAKICPDLVRPKILFTRTGHLVVGNQDEIQVYSTKMNELTHVGSVQNSMSETDFDIKLVELIEAGASNQFAAVYSCNHVQVYSIPS